MTVDRPHHHAAHRRGGHGRLRRGALRRRPGHHGADASSTSAAGSGSTRPCAARPGTAPELAAAAGIDARYAREWLEQQAVAGTLTVDDVTAAPDERRFTLPEEHAIVLLDEEHPAYTGALADVVGPMVRTFDQLVERLPHRRGRGLLRLRPPRHAGRLHPPDVRQRAWWPTWLPRLPDIQARLEAGEPLRIADIGCGEGWAGIYLAEAYPHVTVDGFDLDDTSIAQARKHASERGVADRVRFEVQDVTDTSFGDRYDLVLAVEVVHDLSDPVDALAAMERISRPDGAVLVVDENAAETFDARRRPDPAAPLRLQRAALPARRPQPRALRRHRHRDAPRHLRGLRHPGRLQDRRQCSPSSTSSSASTASAADQQSERDVAHVDRADRRSPVLTPGFGRLNENDVARAGIADDGVGQCRQGRRPSVGATVRRPVGTHGCPLPPPAVQQPSFHRCSSEPLAMRREAEDVHRRGTAGPRRHDGPVWASRPDRPEPSHPRSRVVDVDQHEGERWSRVA